MSSFLFDLAKGKVAAKIAGVFNEVLNGLPTRIVLNKTIEEYGEMIQLNIDNKKQRIEASVLLNGESSPINLEVGKYEIQEENDSTVIVLENVTADRAWINAILKNYIVGRKFAVPKDMVNLFNELLG